MAEAKIQHLDEEAVAKVSQFTRNLAKRFKLLHEYIRNIFKSENMVPKKRKSAPRYSQKQLEIQEALLRKLRDL